MLPGWLRTRLPLPKRMSAEVYKARSREEKIIRGAGVHKREGLYPNPKRTSSISCQQQNIFVFLFHIRILPTTTQKIAFDETPVQMYASDRLPPISHELLRDTCVRYRPNEQVSTGSTAIVEHPNQTAGCMNKTDTYILTKFLNGPNHFISYILEVPRWGLGGPCRPRGHRRWRRLYLRRT